MNEVKYSFTTPGGAVVFFSLFTNSDKSTFIGLNNESINVSIAQLKNIRNAINNFIEVSET